ncbi:glycosyltransferase family 39 protein [Streptomyces sp. A3M-1-3]|uniref:glycosyltransferase family 39 protein n=1 Tax=Streptomyces sp. A3M-1-3 TaxID=2962044 RepID=UPI0020B6939C|nr:glycosyltransferase family 39 protein [Streptomyces sp. A3M-1-3]MCP3821976.1 glycosyltransferase family 39 protein [Streptomyces sp. A3M-1-3]
MTALVSASPLRSTASPARTALRRAAPALLAYAAVRLFGVAVLGVWGAAAGSSPHQLLSARWDSLWYTRVAELGYGYEVRLGHGDVHSNLAFFPLLPWLKRLFSAISPLSSADAGLVVAWTASLFAAWGIFAIADRLYGRRAGTLAVVLWAVLPVGIVQSMAYSETLFTALAAWSLYAVLRGRWVWAGVLASLAGLTRPVGAAVVAAVWVAAAVELIRGPRDGGWGDGGPRGRWRMLLGVVLAPLGAAGYVLWVGHRTGGGLFGYLDVQGQWGNGFDGGWAFARFIGERLASPAFAAGIGLIAGVVLVLRLYRLCVRQRQPLPLLVFCGIVVALALCASGYFGSKPRLLMPAFPLLLPVAVALARLRTSRVALVLGPVALASAVYGAFWLNGTGPP